MRSRLTRSRSRRRLARFLFSLLLLLMVTILAGCNDWEPDTSAPRRPEPERSRDWQGALLYIADPNGPEAGWGSVQAYDNVSGHVEAIVEQTLAAVPSDLYVTDDGSTMYVASSVNGRIDIFTWDGNGWHRKGRTFEPPTSSLLDLEPGPDGRLYAVNGAPAGENDRLFALDPATGDFTAIGLTGVGSSLSGIAWSDDGNRAYLGIDASPPRLTLIDWPGGEAAADLTLPLKRARQVVIGPGGKNVYVAGLGGITVVDADSATVSTVIDPAGDHLTEYGDVAFSADGRFLFTVGSRSQQDGTLYVVDLADVTVVQQVDGVSAGAGGIQRTQ